MLRLWLIACAFSASQEAHCLSMHQYLYYDISSPACLRKLIHLAFLFAGTYRHGGCFGSPSYVRDDGENPADSPLSQPARLRSRLNAQTRIYFCLLLLGLSGIVGLIKPSESIGLIICFLKYSAVLMPQNFCISLRLFAALQ